ncbi:bsp6IM [Symbiodinium sp. CCMP2592]|nr:bsp6IM [Symbiodinium sp. CCMP2592]CAE7328468.1 bsp6IM [Symbiodinium sp. CCMP2592]
MKTVKKLPAMRKKPAAGEPAIRKKPASFAPSQFLRQELHGCAPMRLPNNVMQVASDCSGLCPEGLAAQLATPGFGFEIEHVFASEICPKKRSYINTVIKPKVLSPDMKDASGKEAMRGVHLWCCGFPCQPWSCAGKQKGSEDEDRGNFFGDIFDRISESKPSCFVLENVPGLPDSFPTEFGDLLTVLRGINEGAYNVMWDTLRADLHGGIPQNRSRLYIVGILKTTQIHDFTFPMPVSCTLTLTQILGPRAPDPLPDLQRKTEDNFGRVLCKTVQKNLKRFDKKKPTLKWTDDHIIDTGSSTGHAMEGACPCLTHSRCINEHGYYSVIRDRFLNANDFLRLQGYPDKQHAAMLKGTDEKTLRGMLGNGMCVTVLSRLLRQIFLSQGLVYAR